MEFGDSISRRADLLDTVAVGLHLDGVQLAQEKVHEAHYAVLIAVAAGRLVCGIGPSPGEVDWLEGGTHEKRAPPHAKTAQRPDVLASPLLLSADDIWSWRATRKVVEEVKGGKSARTFRTRF